MERLELLAKSEARAIEQVKESAKLGEVEFEAMKNLPADQAIKRHAKKILVDAAYDIDNKD